MFYCNTKAKTMRNDLFVFEICFAILYVSRGQRGDGYSFVSVQHRTLYRKSFVRFIVAGDVISHKSILVQH